MKQAEIMKRIDEAVDTGYKAGYKNGFRDGAESQRKVIEELLRFNHGDASLAEFMEAEKRHIESQKEES